MINIISVQVCNTHIDLDTFDQCINDNIYASDAYFIIMNRYNLVPNLKKPIKAFALTLCNFESYNVIRHSIHSLKRND